MKLRLLYEKYFFSIFIAILTIVAHNNLKYCYVTFLNVIVSKHVIIYGIVDDIIFDTDVDGNYYTFDIHYTVDNKQYKINKVARPSLDPLKYKKGDKIKIMVSKRHPKYAMVYDTDDIFKYSIIVILWSYAIFKAIKGLFRSSVQP